MPKASPAADDLDQLEPLDQDAPLRHPEEPTTTGWSLGQWRSSSPVDLGERLRRLVPAWLTRRGWGLVAAILAGAIGGLTYGASTHPEYAAQAVLAVPAGATATAPGDTPDAEALAITYATVFQNDGALLSPAAAQLGVSLNELTHHLSVSVETGTSLLLLRYTAPNPSEAIRGVNTIATAVVNQRHASNVVPKDTVNFVQLATSASQNGALARYSVEIGVLLGLLVGSILLLVAERIDPRADRSADIARVFDLPVAAIPTELSVPEFGHAVASATTPESTITLAPLRRADVPATKSITRTLVNGLFLSASGPRLMVSDALEEGLAYRLSTTAALVLVVRCGERMRAVGDALERLRLMGTSPAWVLLLDRYESDS